MSDFLVFLFSLIGNAFSFLDSFIIIGNLSLLKIFLIILLFELIFKFIGGSKDND